MLPQEEISFDSDVYHDRFRHAKPAQIAHASATKIMNHQSATLPLAAPAFAFLARYGESTVSANERADTAYLMPWPGAGL